MTCVVMDGKEVTSQLWGNVLNVGHLWIKMGIVFWPDATIPQQDARLVAMLPVMSLVKN